MRERKRDNDTNRDVKEKGSEIVFEITHPQFKSVGIREDRGCCPAYPSSSWGGTYIASCGAKE
eukprot:820634-Amorphochlora_amoeboformis.AAC.1